jgi:hypothetical protein
MKLHPILPVSALFAFLAACSTTSSNNAVPSATPAAAVGSGAFLAPGITQAELESRVAQFAPALLDFDDTSLAQWEKDVLKILVEASRVMHDIYFVQVSVHNPEYQAMLARQNGGAATAAREYFDIMVGPWDRLEHNQPFLAVPPRPKGAGFYPEDLTAEELEAWIRAHPAEKDAFTGYFTVIRRDANALRALPYSQVYRDQLARAAALLREAAALSRNASLTAFLTSRADAFLSNDYYASDVAWMDIRDSRVEPTIGPYEVYEDELAGYKAAFESFITVVDPVASAELQSLKDHLPDLERKLPIEERYKNPNRPFESPIRVVDVVYTSGDARRGVQTTAFNLPNDVRVFEEKGSKKVMLRNMSQAKFDRILAPIGRELLAPALAAQIAFRPWFTNVVMHELAHGLGPGTITLPTGEKTTVNKALKENYSAIEEAKADVTGLHNLTMLAAEGVYTHDFVRQAFIGHVADFFRAVRFGIGEAHGKANLLQFNYMMDRGALRYDAAAGKFTGEIEAIIAANRQLAAELLTIEAEGSYDRAAQLLRTHGTSVRPEMRAALERLKSVPVDIRPQFAVFDKMRRW